jgi:hypothetical protein
VKKKFLPSPNFFHSWFLGVSILGQFRNKFQSCRFAHIQQLVIITVDSDAKGNPSILNFICGAVSNSSVFSVREG